MTAHTPVPWRLVPSDDAPWPDIEVAPNRRIRVEGRTRDEAEANAHLVVAAPDLLAALEKAENYFQFYDSGGEWLPGIEELVIEARVALAKARGEGR